MCYYGIFLNPNILYVQSFVYFQAIGHPIIGDKLYGGKLERQDKNSLNRQFLHASKLRFTYLNQDYEFNSDLPIDLQLYLKRII